MGEPDTKNPAFTDGHGREAGKRLRQSIPTVLERWCERVRAEIPAAREREHPVLIDHLPRFLECLAEIVAGEAPMEAIPESPSAARLHGEQRARLEGSSLDEMFVEYALLREVTMELLESEGPLPLPARKLLQGGIDRAVRDAVQKYVEDTQQELQRNEWRLRRLQALSDVALARRSLDELLPDLLERIRRMFDADTAAVLLRSGDLLQVRAARGLEAEVEQRVAVPLGRGFAGRIAATGRPLVIPDTGQAEIISPVLREKVRSLLGVPLCLERETVGVLHVGTVEPREFTEEDCAFLELVADRVALAVDRTRLIEELELANERKSVFIDILAHEMRTPLSAVNSATYLLQQIEVDERAVKQLDAIQRQTSHLARLVEDLMDISRISRGKVELRRQPVDLANLAREAAETIQPFVDARGQELTCAMPPELLRIDGDPVRLSQVLVNLLNNANKFTEPGGRLWLDVEQAGSSAVVRIRDTGIGIDPCLLPTLFDLFAQVESSEAKSHGGMGIGLHLVKRLVELHGGTVTAHSEGPGRGAEFTVTLPLALSERAEE